MTAEVVEPLLAWKEQYFPRPRSHEPPSDDREKARKRNRERVIFQRRALRHMAAVADISTNPRFIRVSECGRDGAGRVAKKTKQTRAPTYLESAWMHV